MALILITFFTAVFYVSFILRIISGLKKLGENPRKKLTLVPKITVIIPFRNEAANLPAVVESLAEQDYPRDKLEIIFADDHSGDGSDAVLAGLTDKLNFRFIKISEIGKKKAIEKAVENAGGEIIVITDADCRHPKTWLTSLIGTFESETGFVAGAVMFDSGGDVFGELQKLEFAGIVIASAGLISGGTPFTCSAANIAFRKEAFIEVKGYSGNEEIPSGDDEFLMQKIAYRSDWKVNYAAGKDTIVRTRSNTGIADFFNQRSRWASKGFRYINSAITVQLALIFLFFLTIIIDFSLTGYGLMFLTTALSAFAIKVIADYSALLAGKRALFDGLSLKYFLPAEILHIPYIIIVSLIGTFGGYKWKSREVNK